MKLFDKPLSQYFSTPFHKYDNVCWERDGSRSRRDDESMSRHRRGGATKRWARPAPSANVTVFMKVSTEKKLEWESDYCFWWR